jgi:TM2 domain-containing membrane protein YozV
MKTQITAYCFAIALFFSSCAKETFTFSNTGTSYGSKKQNAAPVSTPQETAPEATINAIAEETTPAENLTASTQQTITLAKKDFVKAKPLHTTQLAAKQDNKEVSKLAQLKAARKVNKEIKTLVKQAEKKVPAATAEGEGKSQIVALVLALAIGWAGIHRFYLGYTGIGIAQLVTLGGCGIWAIIDIIRILMGDLKPKDGDYTKKL